MKELMNYLMLSCQKATELIEKKSFIGLDWKENMQLKAHTALCNACSNYQKQSKVIDGILEQHLHDEEAIPLLENKQLKKNIVQLLEK